MEIQTRSEKTGIRMCLTISEAMEAARLDPTIWKISFSVENGERVRLVRSHDLSIQQDIWVYTPILNLAPTEHKHSAYCGCPAGIVDAERNI